MKQFVAFAASLTLVVPAVLGQLPSCTTACLASHYSESGCKSSTDLKCICSSQAFVATAIECIRSTCSEQDATTSIETVYKLCQAQGVTILTSLPTKTATKTAASKSTHSASMTTDVETSTTAPKTTKTTVLYPYPTPSDSTTLYHSSSSYVTPSGTGTGTGIPRNTSSPTIYPPPAHTDEGAATKMGMSFGAIALAMLGFFAL